MRTLRKITNFVETRRLMALGWLSAIFGLAYVLTFGAGAPIGASAVTTTTVAIDPVSQSVGLITTAAPIAGEIIVGVVGVGIMILLLKYGVGWVWGFFKARRPSA